MKDISHQLVYLTHEGARCLFGSESAPKIIGLPVVTTDPTLVDATIVYGNTYCIHNGAYIGGCISQGAFSEDEPDAEQKTAAIDGYNSHIAMMKERFVHYLVEFGKVDAILSMAKPERVPTLEERAANKKIWDELEKRSPVTLDEARDILNKG